MTYPYITAITAGLLLLMQMALAFAVSGNRGKANTWVGDGGNVGLLRSARRHANLAENAGTSRTPIAFGSRRSKGRAAAARRHNV